MKMARASQADLDAANDVSRIVGELEKGYMPSADEVEDTEFFDRDDPEQCRRALCAILGAAAKGSLFRVTFGMAVVLDPRNELLDPAADTLERHPKIVAALNGAPPTPHAEATSWQPIETVPMDGTEVVLLFDDEVALLGKTRPRVRAASWLGDWTIPYRRDNPPTHWMPLPGAPVVAAIAGGQ